MNGVVMLEADYFANNTIHTPIEFHRHFRMNIELFIKIVVGGREYDDYFVYKEYCAGLAGFTAVRNALLL
jgi:hypothetical protein